MKELIPMDKRTNILVGQALNIASTDLDKALRLVNEAFFGLGNVEWIKHCVKETVIRWWELAQPREQDVYDWFKDNFKSYFSEDAKIIKRKNDPNHKPDFWVFSFGEIMPTECKLRDFDKKALKQLQRYMEFYHCAHGVAVASDFTCEVPKNIKKIKFERKNL